MAVLDKPNEATNTHFCSEKITHACTFVHANSLRVMRISIDELSEAESEWVDDSCSSDSYCLSEAAEFLQLSDVTKLVN
jgi:hypothetical protein